MKLRLLTEPQFEALCTPVVYRFLLAPNWLRIFLCFEQPYFIAAWLICKGLEK